MDFRALLAAAVVCLAVGHGSAQARPGSWPHQGISDGAFEAAMDAFKAHRSEVTDTRYLTIVDYTLPSDEPRLFILDRDTGKVQSYLVAHGRGSDPGFTGMATKFSNTSGSRMSSLGAYVTENTYYGKHGLSLRLDGLDATNSNAYERAIVVHGADYVSPGRSVQGRSWGCPAVEERYASKIIGEIKDGTLLYVYGDDADETHTVASR
jgi:hypothetical protein